MVTMFVRHRVADYKAWRKVLDEYHPARQRAGVIGEEIYQSADDPNDITLLFEFATIEAARAFPENEELQTAYRKAGSIGPPSSWFATKV